MSWRLPSFRAAPHLRPDVRGRLPCPVADTGRSSGQVQPWNGVCCASSRRFPTHIWKRVAGSPDALSSGYDRYCRFRLPPPYRNHRLRKASPTCSLARAARVRWGPQPRVLKPRPAARRRKRRRTRREGKSMTRTILRPNKRYMLPSERRLGAETHEYLPELCDQLRTGAISRARVHAHGLPPGNGGAGCLRAGGHADRRPALFGAPRAPRLRNTVAPCGVSSPCSGHEPIRPRLTGRKSRISRALSSST